MGTSLRAFFLCFIWASIMAMQLNFDQDTTATRKLKDALELATHDAALVSLQTDSLADGKFIFDQNKAKKVITESLQNNLLLDSSLQPLADTFFHDKIEIKLIDFVDDNHPNVTGYPTNYSNPTYEILDTIDGPAIVVVLETKGPRFFKGDKKTIRQPVVYEYKF